MGLGVERGDVAAAAAFGQGVRGPQAGGVAGQDAFAQAVRPVQLDDLAALEDRDHRDGEAGAARADLLEHRQRVFHRRAATAVAGGQRHRVPAVFGGLRDQVDRVEVRGVDVVGDRADGGAGELAGRGGDGRVGEVAPEVRVQPRWVSSDGEDLPVELVHVDGRGRRGPPGRRCGCRRRARRRARRARAPRARAAAGRGTSRAAPPSASQAPVGLDRRVPVRCGAVPCAGSNRPVAPDPSLLVRVDGRRPAQGGRAGAGADDVGQDVAEDALGGDHRGQPVELDQLVGGAVDVEVLERDVPVGGDGLGDGAPQPGGGEDVGLVDAEVAAPGRGLGEVGGQLEHLADPFGQQADLVGRGAGAVALGAVVLLDVGAVGDVADDGHVAGCRGPRRCAR